MTFSTQFALDPKATGVNTNKNALHETVQVVQPQGVTLQCYHLMVPVQYDFFLYHIIATFCSYPAVQF